MPEAPIGYILAFDFGLKHIGSAVGQTVTGTASPLRTLGAKSGKPVWREVDELVEAWQPLEMVVGLPLNMDGTESDMSEQARAFGHALAQRYDLAVHLVDERLSTREALERTGGEHQAAHNVAAVLIAESYLR